MIKLDKSRKLNDVTYFTYPSAHYGDLIQLMQNSNEHDFKCYGPSKRKEIMPKELFTPKCSFYPDDPNWTSSLFGVCVSNYPTDYLKEKLLEIWTDPERVETKLKEGEELAKKLYPEDF